MSVAFFLGVHDIDMMLWTMGQPVVKAFAKSVRRGPLPVEDSILSILTFADGTLAMVENWRGAPDVTGRPQRFHFEAVGTGGVIEVYGQEQGVGIYTPQAATFPPTLFLPEVHGRLTGIYHDQVAHFVDCIRKGTPPACTGEEGLEAVRVGVAIERSLREGQEVTV